MNKNTMLLFGGIVVIVVAGLFFYIGQNMTTIGSGVATTTPATSTTTPVVTPPSGGGTPVPGLPVPTTNATAAPTGTTAVVTGSVVPNGAETSYWYEYGPTSTFGKKTSAVGIGAGYTATPAPGYITGLIANTTYYFRLVAQNAYGQVAGAQRTFMTSSGTPPPVGGVPSVKSLSASSISNNSVSLNASVNPNQVATQYWFEYGTNGTLSNVTTFVSVGSGNTTMPVSASLSNLSQGTTYYYRIDAQNQFGTVNGAILTFKTSGAVVHAVPVVTTQTISAVATTTATLVGTVNPYGSQTKYWFEYSVNAQFATSSLTSTSQRSVGAGALTVTVQSSIKNLKPATTYYVRIAAQNAGGIVRGSTQSFTTK